MKTLVALFAGEITPLALEPLSGGRSAFARALATAVSLPSHDRVVVFASERHHNGFRSAPVDALRSLAAGIDGSVEIIVGPSWTASSFFSRLSSESEGFENVILYWADMPCVDAAFTSRLMERHSRYAAEYTFAEGYPAGLAPEILNRGILPVLVRLSAGDDGPMTRDSVFETIKKDINSFDIETDLAPVDLRHLRLNLACDTRQNFLLCEALAGIDAGNYAALAEQRSGRLRTVPAFYAVQVAGGCPFECAFCPYPAFTSSGKGRSPGVRAFERTDFMPAGDFERMVEKIADFSGNATVSLSLWGECSRHPDIVRLVSSILAHSALSVLIETTGIGWTDESLRGIAEAARKAGPRSDGKDPVNWIVSLDAVSEQRYASLRTSPIGSSAPGGSPVGGQATSPKDLFRTVLAFVNAASDLFPGSVWPQMMRMNENEEELEAFYRFWKDKLGRVIIQKHDHFCGSIVDRRVADLSPLGRHPCWHLKRDMSILIDGTVPLCREDLYAARSMGNAMTGELPEIWNGFQPVYEQHVTCNYEGMCGACDEFYTYNF